MTDESLLQLFLPMKVAFDQALAAYSATGNAQSFAKNDEDRLMFVLLRHQLAEYALQRPLAEKMGQDGAANSATPPRPRFLDM